MKFPHFTKKTLAAAASLAALVCAFTLYLFPLQKQSDAPREPLTPSSATTETPQAAQPSENSVLTEGETSRLIAQKAAKQGSPSISKKAAKSVAKIEDLADRKSTRLNSSHPRLSRMPSSA